MADSRVHVLVSRSAACSATRAATTSGTTRSSSARAQTAARHPVCWHTAAGRAVTRPRCSCAPECGATRCPMASQPRPPVGAHHVERRRCAAGQASPHEVRMWQAVRSPSSSIECVRSGGCADPCPRSGKPQRAPVCDGLRLDHLEALLRLAPLAQARACTSGSAEIASRCTGRAGRNSTGSNMRVSQCARSAAKALGRLCAGSPRSAPRHAEPLPRPHDRADESAGRDVASRSEICCGTLSSSRGASGASRWRLEIRPKES